MSSGLFSSPITPSSTHPPLASTEAENLERFRFEQAENLLKAAVNADIRGNNSDAFEYYQHALNIWLEILSQTTDETRKSQIADLIAVYMSKAEAVKVRLRTPQPPVRQSNLQPKKASSRPTASASAAGATTASSSQETKIEEHESIILSEMLDSSPGIRWSDIIGLEFAKRTIQEAVIYPYLRPDIFRGLRAPPKGVLLYGPPGTGKTMIAKAVATESGFKFFNISASTVMNKYLGEGEKLMKV
jgi:SpoVK/Ycf46/Vps4 family AAA+-type ATPase